MRPKFRQAALWAGNVQEAIQVVIFNTRAQKTAMQLIFTIALANTAPLQNGAVFFPDGTTRGFEARSHTTQPTVNGQRLAPSHKPIRISANTRIMQPSSLYRGEASRNALFFQTLILPHSLLHHFFFVSRSDPNSPLSLMSRPLIIHSKGVVCLLSSLEVGFSPAQKCPARLLF